jgi:pyruvate,water dikinase
MKTIITDTSASANSIVRNISGIKADMLTHLDSLGFQIPTWMVIPSTVFSEHIPDAILELPSPEVISFIRNIKLDPSLIDSIYTWIHENGMNNDLFAVRSSICIDSSDTHTFAGQLKTNLCVPQNELPDAILDVWTSPFSSKASAYCAQWGIQPGSIRMAVIIQKMVETESSGIAMSFDPSNGSRSNISISSVYGINVTNSTSRTDSDQFTINFSGSKPTRVSKIFEKRTRIAPNLLTGSGTVIAPVPYSIRTKSSLSANQVMALATLTRALSLKTGKPQIIDWALSKGKFYIFQTRAVSSLENIPDTTEKQQAWQSPSSDLYNSKHVSPLLYSIIKKYNANAYRSFYNRTRFNAEKPINDFEFLGYNKGHIYIDEQMYEKITGALPFGSLVASFHKKTSFFESVHSHLSLLLNCVKNKGINEKLINQLCTTDTFKAPSFLECKFKELLDTYLEIEEQLSLLWESIIENEHYINAINSLLFTKTKNQTFAIQDFFNPVENLSNNSYALDELQNISLIVDEIQSRPAMRDLFGRCTNSEIRKQLFLDSSIPPQAFDVSFAIIRKLILRHVDRFNYHIDTLTDFISSNKKLDSFISVLRIYSSQCKSFFENIREPKIPSPSKTDEEKKYPFSFTLTHKTFLHKFLSAVYASRKTLNKVKNVQLSRMKQILCVIAKKLYAEGILDALEDIQFLTRDEIEDYISGRSVTTSLKSLASLRKQELSNEKQSLPHCSFTTHGIVYHSQCQNISQLYNNQNVSLFQGIGNGMDVVQGKVVIADDPGFSDSLEKAILVIGDSNPGWIQYLPLVKGVIIENGSLLSELSLTCSRLKIPLVVSETSYFKEINNGEIVELDSNSGKIFIINRMNTAGQMHSN